MTTDTNVLNTLRVALDRADFNYHITGLKDCEVEAAKAWVRAALASQAQAPLTPNQLRALEWFSARDWVPYREWRREMTTKTPSSLFKRGLLDFDPSKTTTAFRISDVGRAVLAQETAHDR